MNGVVTKFLILAALLAIAFILSAAEVALYTLTSSGEHVKGRLKEYFFKSPQVLLSTILVSNAVAVFLFSLIGASAALDLAEKLKISNTIAVTAEVIIISGLLIFFADAVPKIVALGNPRLLLDISFPVVLLLLVVESPVVYPLNRFLSRITSRRKRNPLSIDNEGLKTLSKIAGRTGVIDENEAELLRKISFLGERNVRDTMTTREEIVSLSRDAGFDDVVGAFRKSEHSRLPVYSESPDNIVGMLYARDVLPLLKKKTSRKQFAVGQIMRSPVFVPETQSLEKLLETYRANKVHIAIVVDEFGGISGLVTLSDVVREIFGSSAELPREGARLLRLQDGSIIAKGSTRLGELAGYLGAFGFEYEPGDTVSLLLSTTRGSVPRVGNKTRVGNLEFEVVQATPKAVLQVRVRQLYFQSANDYD